MEEEFNLDEELKEVRERREQKERERKQELDEYLSRLRLVRTIKNGVVLGLTATVIVSGIICIRRKNQETQKPDPYTIEEVNTDTITLTRNYTVEFGDTLSAISNTTGIPQSRIINDNDIENGNMIYMNQRLQLNYKINPDDLEYYTETVLVDGRSLADLAFDYDTTQQTIINLNHNSIIDNGDGTYNIVSNTLVVPNFISVNEYNELKGSHK